MSLTFSCQCPVDQILDNPEHRGTFQSTLQLSAIYIRVSTHIKAKLHLHVFIFYQRPRVGSKVYVVLSVLPTDSECLGSSRDLIDGLVMVNLTGKINALLNYFELHAYF